MSNILLVEDDPVLGRGLSVQLELEGYKVQWARSLKAAFETYRASHFDLVVLDLGLPDGDGLSFVKELRETTNTDKDHRTPIVILTARSDEDSVVKGLNAGANDYVRKPFGNRELLARIRTVLTTLPSGEKMLKYGELQIHPDRRKATYEEREIDLNRREFDLLCFFVKRAEMVVTRDTLLQLFGKDEELMDRTVDSHVSHLRARLRKAGAATIQISSVYGVGYRLERA
jgi:DNA-binding response OmpR family regulator